MPTFRTTSVVQLPSGVTPHSRSSVITSKDFTSVITAALQVLFVAD